MHTSQSFIFSKRRMSVCNNVTQMRVFICSSPARPHHSPMQTLLRRGGAFPNYDISFGFNQKCLLPVSLLPWQFQIKKPWEGDTLVSRYRWTTAAQYWPLIMHRQPQCWSCGHRLLAETTGFTRKPGTRH